jgi:hypothetical protein
MDLRRAISHLSFHFSNICFLLKTMTGSPSGNQLQEYEMGRAYSMHKGDVRCIKVLGGKLIGRDHLGDLGKDRRII